MVGASQKRVAEREVEMDKMGKIEGGNGRFNEAGKRRREERQKVERH